MAYGFRSFARFTCLAWLKSRGTDHRLTPKRIAWLVAFYAIYPLLELVVWIGFALDEILFRGYRRQRIRQPVFILGHPRSGTTFLYHLMARDDRNFTCMRTWQIFFAPSIALRKICRALGALDRRIGNPTQKLLTRWEKRCQDKIVMHRLGLLAPEEDEYLLLHIWSTILIWVFAAILEGAPPLTYFDTRIPPADKEHIMSFYRRCLQRHLYTLGNPRMRARHYLAKDPSFCPKIGSLYEWFPDARFIYLVRNPLNAVASYVSGVDYGWRLLGDPVEKYGCRDFILEMARHWYGYPLERLDRAPSDSYLLVKFDDLVSDTERTIVDIYRHFGFDISPAFAQIVREEAKKSRAYRSQHKYSLKQIGLTREQIVTECREVFNRFGFATSEQ